MLNIIPRKHDLFEIFDIYRAPLPRHPNRKRENGSITAYKSLFEIFITI